MSVLPCCPPCADLLTLTPSCPPHAVLLTLSARTVLVPSSSHPPPHTVPFMLFRLRLMLSPSHCPPRAVALLCHSPCTILPSSLHCPPHASVWLVPFPCVTTPCCLLTPFPTWYTLSPPAHQSNWTSIQTRCALGLPTPPSCPTNGRPTFTSYLVFPISFFPHSSLIFNVQPTGTHHHGQCRSPPDDPSSSITHWCPITKFSVLSLHAVTWSV